MGYGKQLFNDKKFDELLTIVNEEYKTKKKNLNLKNAFENYFKSEVLQITPQTDDHTFAQKREFLLDFYIHLIRNLCLISFLNAQKFQVSSVVYTGNFLKGNYLAKNMISEIFRQKSDESKLKLRPIFLEVDGFLGSYTCLNIELEKRKFED